MGLGDAIRNGIDEAKEKMEAFKQQQQHDHEDGSDLKESDPAAGGDDASAEASLSHADVRAKADAALKNDDWGQDGVGTAVPETDVSEDASPGGAALGGSALAGSESSDPGSDTLLNGNGQHEVIDESGSDDLTMVHPVVNVDHDDVDHDKEDAELSGVDDEEPGDAGLGGGELEDYEGNYVSDGFPERRDDEDEEEFDDEFDDRFDDERREGEDDGREDRPAFV